MHAWAHGLHQLTIVKMDVETTIYTSAVRVSRPAFDQKSDHCGMASGRAEYTWRLKATAAARAERRNLRRPRPIIGYIVVYP